MSTAGETAVSAWRTVADDRTLLWATLIAGLATGVIVGLAPGRWDGVLLLATAVCVTAVVGAFLRGPAPPRPPRPRMTGRQVLAIAAMYLVVASTLVFRQRTATDIADNPLDIAGQFRVLALGGAVVLACASMLSLRFTLRGVPVAGWLAIAYVATVPLGAVDAVSPSLVMFKWGELAAFLVVWLALTRAFPGDATVPLRHVGIIVGVLLSFVLAGIVLSPDRAIQPIDGVVPFQLASPTPDMHPNDVGTLGMLVVAFGLGRRRVSPGVVALGMAVVVATQYRTGYVGVLAMVLVWLVLRGHGVARVALVALAVLGPIAAQNSTIERLWLRDDFSAGSVTTLTGRTVWWDAAFDAAERSPLVGIGLSSGVRYEVLQDRFSGFTSTIHNSWVEAYVGAGLLGVGLLAGAVLGAVGSALKRWRWDGELLPVLLLTMLTVRSITGSAFEIGGLLFLVFLLAIAAAADRPVRDDRPSESELGPDRPPRRPDQAVSSS